MKKYIKKLLKIITILSTVTLYTIPVLATGGSSSGWFSSTLSTVESGGVSTSLTSTTQSIVSTIIDVVQIVGVGVAIIMLTFLGIKYMSAAPSEKADFKKSATAYVVGAIILFASVGILEIIAQLAENISASGSATS